MPLRAPMSRPVGIAVGLLLVALAVTVATAARRQMVRTGQSPIPWKPSPELILRGPYKFTRNPMYLGLTVLEIGVGLALDNLWISLLAFPALAAVHFIAVLPEERYLSAKFGEPYRAYLVRVRRYI
jgi:protein-S-isoprenylcysteine O-methyltransferase Ste14